MGLYVPSFKFLSVLLFFYLAWFECCVIEIGAAFPILVLRCMNDYAFVNLLISLFQGL